MRRALAFLTPIGGAVPPSAEAVRWFPFAGLVIGGATGVVWWGADQIWPPAVAAAVAVVADLLLTGMLHLDGLVDSADGLLPPLPRGAASESEGANGRPERETSRERRLDVMADPAAGAFGVAAAISVLLLRLTALAAMSPAPLLLAAVWSASRTVMAWTIGAVPYARPGGLATAFMGPTTRVVAGGALLAVFVGVAGHGPKGALAVGAAFLAGVAVVQFARRRIDGFTGDVLGAAGIVAETVGLLVAAGRW